MSDEPITYLTNVKDVDPTTLEKISISEHKLLTHSTQDWYYSYVLGLSPKKTAAYFTKGSFLHEIMETYWLARYNNAPFNLSEASTAARKSILTERQAIVSEPDRLEVESTLATWMKEQDTNGVKVAEVDGTPAVELEFYVDIGLRNMNGERVVIHGLIDLMTVEGKKLVVQDWKTASRAWSQVQLQTDLQGPIYAEVVKELTGVVAEEVRYNFFYPKGRFESKSIYPTDKHRAVLVQELQKGVWLRDSGSIVRNTHWSAAMSAYAPIAALEMQGIDASDLIEREYVVNDEKAERYARFRQED